MTPIQLQIYRTRVRHNKTLKSPKLTASEEDILIEDLLKEDLLIEDLLIEYLLI
jgi:hypothetical protein